jgi:very-short-patch-repair endonuclease
MVSINEEDARKLYQDDGLSMRQVAEKLGVPLASLSRFMKRHGIVSRDKGQAQKNYLRDHDHQMRGRKHTDATKEKISKGLGEFWEKLPEETKEEVKRKIGSAWRRKWEQMTDTDRKTMMESLSSRAKETQGMGSRLERFIAEELRKRGYTVEERTTNYTMGKAFEIDIALPTERIAIEIDGPTHFIAVYGEERLKEQQERDSRKDELINGTGYSMLRIRDNNGPLSQVRIDKIEKAIQEIKADGTVSVWYVEE